MSCNAHRIDKILYAKHVSFSLWHDNVIDVLIAASSSKNGYLHDQRNCDGVGIIEVPVTLLVIASENKMVSPEIKAAIRKDIAYAKKHNNDIVLYDCN